MLNECYRLGQTVTYLPLTWQQAAGEKKESFNRQIQRLNTTLSTSTWAITELQPTRRLSLLLPGCDAAAILCMHHHAVFQHMSFWWTLLSKAALTIVSGHIFVIRHKAWQRAGAPLLELKRIQANDHKWRVVAAETFLSGRNNPHWLGQTSSGQAQRVNVLKWATKVRSLILSFTCKTLKEKVHF